MSGERMTDAALADLLKVVESQLGHAADVGATYVAFTRDETMRIAAALRASPQAVAEGFVLVPIEPTKRMMIAGAGSWVGWQESSMHDYLPTPDEVRDVYRAMLAASQSATGGAT